MQVAHTSWRLDNPILVLMHLILRLLLDWHLDLCVEPTYDGLLRQSEEELA